MDYNEYSPEKQPIVPKNSSKKIKINIIGDYSLTILEVVYLLFTLILMVLTLLVMPIVWLKWGIVATIVVSYLGFASVGHYKLYQLMVKITIHSFAKKRFVLPEPKLQEKDDLIYKPKSKMFFDVFELRPASLEVAEMHEMNNAFEEVEELLREVGQVKFYLLNHSEFSNVSANEEFLNEKLKDSSGVKEKMIESFLESTDEASKRLTGKYYLVIKSPNRSLLERSKVNVENFRGKYLEISNISMEKKESVLLKQSDVYGKKTKIKIGYNKVKIEDSYCKYLVLDNSKPVLNWFWLNDFAYDPWVEFTIIGQKKNSEQSIKYMNKQLNRSIQRLKESGDMLKSAEIQDNIESFQLTINNLRGDEQAIYDSLVLIKVWGDTPQAVDQKAKKVRLSLGGSGAKFSVPFAENRETWKVKAPLAVQPPEKFSFFKDMLSYTLGAAWGFASVLLKDDKGMVLGHSSAGSIFWDPKMTNEDLQKDELNRKNLNIAILGGSGSGKSTLTQKIVNWNVVTGGAVWVIDPKDEDYFGLAKEYDGDIFEFGLNDGVNKLNPFEIIGWKEMSVSQRKHEIVSHGEFLDGWLDILFNDKDFKNKIISVVKEAYLNKEKNHNLKWLTFSDIEKKFIKKGGSFKQLVDKFSIFSADGHFLNGQSNIENILDKDFVVFQTSKIFNASSELMKNAGLVLLTQLIQTKAKLNKNSGKVFHAIIDEAHNFFNTTIGKHKIESLIREARGWNSGVVLISQNPGDFMGGKIMNNITTTFYGALDSETINSLSKNLTISNEREGLNRLEKKFILSASRGQFLIVINSFNKATIQIDVTNMEFKAIRGELVNMINLPTKDSLSKLTKKELLEILSQKHEVEEFKKFNKQEIIEFIINE